MFWRLHGHDVERGIRFDTSDIKDIDLEALERGTISTGAFRIDAFFSYSEECDYKKHPECDYKHHVFKDIVFREDKAHKKQSERLTPSAREEESRYGVTGSISYKDNEVIGDNNKICLISRNGASECPE